MACKQADVDTDSDVAGARALGWASIGIGLTELAAPQKVQDMLGLEDTPEHRGILRVLGVRELMHGISILTEREPSRQLATSVWSRVVGDALDAGLLALASIKTQRPGRFAAVAASVNAIGMLDVLYAFRVQRARWLNAHPTKNGLPSTR